MRDFNTRATASVGAIPKTYTYKELQMALELRHEWRENRLCLIIFTVVAFASTVLATALFVRATRKNETIVAYLIWMTVSAACSSSSLLMLFHFWNSQRHAPPIESNFDVERGAIRMEDYTVQHDPYVKQGSVRDRHGGPRTRKTATQLTRATTSAQPLYTIAERRQMSRNTKPLPLAPVSTEHMQQLRTERNQMPLPPLPAFVHTGHGQSTDIPEYPSLLFTRIDWPLPLNDALKSPSYDTSITRSSSRSTTKKLTHGDSFPKLDGTIAQDGPTTSALSFERRIKLSNGELEAYPHSASPGTTGYSISNGHDAPAASASIYSTSPLMPKSPSPKRSSITTNTTTINRDRPKSPEKPKSGSPNRQRNRDLISGALTSATARSNSRRGKTEGGSKRLSRIHIYHDRPSSSISPVNEILVNEDGFSTQRPVGHMRERRNAITTAGLGISAGDAIGGASARGEKENVVFSGEVCDAVASSPTSFEMMGFRGVETYEGT